MEGPRRQDPKRCKKIRQIGGVVLRIIVDAMGGDNAPQAIIDGAVAAAQEIEHQIALVGPKNQLQELLDAACAKGASDNIIIIGADDVIDCNEPPVKAIKSKPGSTIVTGLNIVKDGYGDVFVSAGSTGALLAGGLLICGRIKGIDRPAICSLYPSMKGGISLLADAGANAECKARNLYEFGLMGSIYMENVLGKASPKIALANIGAEAEKGTDTVKKAYAMLSESDLNFIGNIEARDIPAGKCDVIVADGFTGNIILKLSEGLVYQMMKEMAGNVPKEASSAIAASFDYSEYGGAPVLGVSRPLIKMHGSSNAKAVKNAIFKAADFVENDVIGIIQSRIR